MMRNLLHWFKRPVTCSQAGKLGNAVRRERERERIRAKCREMLHRMGRDVPDVLA